MRIEDIAPSIGIPASAYDRLAHAVRESHLRWLNLQRRLLECCEDELATLPRWRWFKSWRLARQIKSLRACVGQAEALDTPRPSVQ